MPPFKIENTGPTYAEAVRGKVRQAGLTLGDDDLARTLHDDDLARTLHDDAGHFGAFAFCNEPACLSVTKAAR